MLNKLRTLKERKYGRVFVEEHEKIVRLRQIFTKLSRDHNLDYNYIEELFKSRQKYIAIPAGLFNNKLSPLENVILFLTLEHRLSQTEIANLLNRDHTTIWTTFNKAMKKIPKSRFREFISKLKRDVIIPINLLSNRKLSILESVSTYLKENYKMSNHDISIMLGKNDRTIWTVIDRAKKKNEK